MDSKSSSRVSFHPMIILKSQTYLTFDARKVNIESISGIKRNAGSGRSRNRREGIDRCGEEKKGDHLGDHLVFGKSWQVASC